MKKKIHSIQYGEQSGPNFTKKISQRVEGKATGKSLTSISMLSPVPSLVVGFFFRSFLSKIARLHKNKFKSKSTKDHCAVLAYPCPVSLSGQQRCWDECQ